MSDSDNGHGAMEGTPPPPKAIIMLSLKQDTERQASRV